MDCPRRRPSHAPSFPPQTTSDLEKLQTSNIQRGSARGQLDPDEKRPENIPLPLEVRVITITTHSIRLRVVIKATWWKVLYPLFKPIPFA